MAIAYVTSNSGSHAGTGSTLTVSVTVSGTNTYLVAYGAVRNAGGASPSSCTADGSSMTALGTTQVAGAVDVQAFGIAAPTAGTINVVMTFSGTSRCAMVVAVYEGVDQSTPTGTVQAEADVNQTVSSATGRMLVGCGMGTISTGPNFTASGSLTEREEAYTTSGGPANFDVVIGDIAGDTSVNVVWTPSYTEDVSSKVIELLPASASGRPRWQNMTQVAKRALAAARV